jgi:hypothetical protein
MPQVGWLDSSGKPVAFADALAISEAEGSWSNIPHEVLSLIEQQVTKDRPDGITVTQLLGCPRKVFLEKQTDYYQTPMDNWPALRGTIVHAMLEQQGGGGASVEVRYEKELRDWKSTNNLPKYDSVYSSHRLQVNLYRWLMDLDPRFTEIEVVYISMDGVKAIPLKRGGTSRYGRAIADELMSNEQVEEYLDKRLFTLYAQNEAQKPLAYHNVDEEDLWNCNYCPVKNLCYKMAADEAKAAFIKDEPVNRVPPRQRKEKK